MTNSKESTPQVHKETLLPRLGNLNLALMEKAGLFILNLYAGEDRFRPLAKKHKKSQS